MTALWVKKIKRERPERRDRKAWLKEMVQYDPAVRGTDILMPGLTVEFGARWATHLRTGRITHRTRATMDNMLVREGFSDGELALVVQDDGGNQHRVAVEMIRAVPRHAIEACQS